MTTPPRTDGIDVRRIRKLLIANRGEIARRVQRTARSMGIDTVAVYSDADAAAPFVREADEGVRLGPAPAAESYLDADAVLAAARATGADAIHPGYGFLAENADFASAVEAAGIRFVGPPPQAIRAMGLKREAKAIAVEAGVPVIPGYDGADQDPAVLAAKAAEVGFPVLLKASAGGGGKGMQIVRDADALGDAIASARRVAESAFGDGTLLVERYLERPRHVEIQILGDAHGNVVHLHERECSIQRRHQKILEESPSVALDDATRAAMGDAAVRLAQAIGYRSAGTVEMIVDATGAFFFLEVNTRLQVEHPVTEMVTGIDLVREQIRIAEGEPLGYGQDEVRPRGAALEARLYAEDPANGYLPQAGTLVDFHLPDDVPGLRIDTGVETGSEVSVHYDPMIAKLVTHGPTRAEATRAMARAMRRLSVHGVATNRALLVAILDHPAYLAGHLHTHFLDDHQLPAAGLDDDVADSAGPTRAEAFAAVAATAVELAGEPPANPSLPALRPGFRSSRFRPEIRGWRLAGTGDAPRSIDVRLIRGPDRGLTGAVVPEGVDPEAEEGADPPASPFDVRVVEVTGAGAGVEVTLVDRSSGHRRQARVVRHRTRSIVQTRPDGRVIVLDARPAFPDPTGTVDAGALTAPMPGKVVSVRVAVGDTVDEGQVLLVLEAMKMEHPVLAPTAGRVAALPVAEGDQVDADAILAVVEPGED